MRINHNSMALNASDHFATVNKKIAKSMERLSSGYKITSPADDAAGLAISTKMNAQIKGLERAARNSNDGISVIQSAEGGLSEIQNILARMRELATKAANDVLAEEDRDSIQEEIDSLRAEIDQIVDTTAFNDQKLLNGDATRRSLSTDKNIKATYISDAVHTGTYNISVTAPAKQALLGTGISVGGGAITAQQAGTVKVNGFDVTISEGMTMSEVFDTMQTHLYKIGIDVYASADGTTESDFASGGSVYLRTRGYGSSEEIDITISNPELAAALGMNDGAHAEGDDCTASIDTTGEGFSTTASVSTDGNSIRVVDRNGFEMQFETEPGATGIDSTIEVLSAGTMIIQTGGNSGEQVSLDIPSVSAKSLAVDDLVMYTHGHAAKAIETIDEAVKKVSAIRSKLGAYENRLDDNYDNLQVQNESITSAYSRIMDTDMADELTNYTQLEVLSQAAIEMIKKSNERPESILQLLQ